MCRFLAKNIIKRLSDLRISFKRKIFAPTSTISLPPSPTSFRIILFNYRWFVSFLTFIIVRSNVVIHRVGQWNGNFFFLEGTIIDAGILTMSKLRSTHLGGFFSNRESTLDRETKRVRCKCIVTRHVFLARFDNRPVRPSTLAIKLQTNNFERDEV